MLDISRYQKMEAIEELLDEYDLVIASLDAAIVLGNLRIQIIESKLKLNRPANSKAIGYLRLIGFKKEAHINELRRITYRQYQDGLRERLDDSNRGGKKPSPVKPKEKRWSRGDAP